MNKDYFKYTDRTLTIIEVQDEVVEGYNYIKTYKISSTGFIYFLIGKYDINFSNIIHELKLANEHNYEIGRESVGNLSLSLYEYNEVTNIHLNHLAILNDSICNNIDKIIDQYYSSSIYSYYYLHMDDKDKISYEEYYKLSNNSNSILKQDISNLKKLLMKDLHIIRFNNILEVYKLYNFKQQKENISLKYSSLKFDINIIMDYYTKYDCSIKQIAEHLLSTKEGITVRKEGLASFINVDLNYSDPNMSDRSLKNLRLNDIINNL